MTTQPGRSGFITIAGRPNMGKSTLLNALLGKKIAIVTPKAQTTRTRILGVCHRPDCQMVFVDTPGIHQARSNPLNQAMVETAFASCREVDLILYMVEAARGITEADWVILKQLPRGETPVMLLLNKMDRVNAQQMLPVLAKVAEGSQVHGIDFAEIIPVSATTNKNVERLLGLIAARLPEGPNYFPVEQITDQPDPFLAAEIVREKLFFLLNQELPYALAVRTTLFKKAKNILHVHATIVVERDSQKGIVIGHKGEMLKQVGTKARVEMARLFGQAVFLKLQVEVSSNWTADPRKVNAYGYGEEGPGGETAMSHEEDEELDADGDDEGDDAFEDEDAHP